MSFRNHHQFIANRQEYSEILDVVATVKDTYITNLIIPAPKKEFNPATRKIEEVHDIQGYSGPASLVQSSNFSSLDDFITAYMTNTDEVIEEAGGIDIERGRVSEDQCLNRESYQFILDIQNIENLYDGMQEAERRAEEICIQNVNDEEREDYKKLYDRWRQEDDLAENLELNPNERIGEGADWTCEFWRWAGVIQTKINSYNCQRQLCQITHNDWRWDDTQKELAKKIRDLQYLISVRLCRGETVKNTCPDMDPLYREMCKLQILMKFRNAFYELARNFVKNHCDARRAHALCREQAYNEWFNGYPFPSGSPNSWDSPGEQESALCETLSRCKQDFLKSRNTNIQEYQNSLIKLSQWLKDNLILCDCNETDEPILGSPSLDVLGFNPFAPLEIKPPDQYWWEDDFLGLQPLRDWGIPPQFIPTIPSDFPQPRPSWENSPFRWQYYPTWTLEWLQYWERNRGRMM